MDLLKKNQYIIIQNKVNNNNLYLSHVHRKIAMWSMCQTKNGWQMPREDSREHGFQKPLHQFPKLLNQRYWAIKSINILKKESQTHLMNQYVRNITCCNIRCCHCFPNVPIN